MKQLRIDLDDELAKKLLEIVPERERSEFVGRAIRKALWDLEEGLTAEAYRRTPDTANDVYVDPRVWQRVEPRQSRRLKK
jgi:Arc/MetJ family transcription regulator